MRKFITLAKFLWAFWITAASVQCLAQDVIPPAPEYRVKAGFLANFVKYVTWPAQADSQPDSPYLIGILGDDPYGPFLDQVCANVQVGGKRIEVRRFGSLQDLTYSHLLFIDRRQEENLTLIRQQLNGLPTVTVSEGDGFGQRGIMINFFIENGRVRFEVNLDEVRRAGLTVSTPLLRLARIVDSRNK